MKYIFPIMLVFLLVPAFAFSETVTIISDNGVNVEIGLDALAQDTYAKAKADFGDDIMQRILKDWIRLQTMKYERNEAAIELKAELDSLPQARKQKVMDFIDACKLGSC